MDQVRDPHKAQQWLSTDRGRDGCGRRWGRLAQPQGAQLSFLTHVAEEALHVTSSTLTF